MRDAKSEVIKYINVHEVTTWSWHIGQRVTTPCVLQLKFAYYNLTSTNTLSCDGCTVVLKTGELLRYNTNRCTSTKTQPAQYRHLTECVISFGKPDQTRPLMSTPSPSKTHTHRSQIVTPPTLSDTPQLAEVALHKLHEAASILIWLDSGYLGTSAMLHSLGGLCRTLLHSIVCEYVDECHEIDLIAGVPCTKQVVQEKCIA